MKLQTILKCLFLSSLVVLLMSCSSSFFGESKPEKDEYALTIKSSTVDAHCVKVEATYICLSGKVAVSEVGVAVRPVGTPQWLYVAAESVASPFVVIVNSLESQSDYELAAYVLTAKSERFMSPSRTVKTDMEIYDPTPDPDSVLWCELPDVEIDNGKRFVTHFTQIEGARRRNYSMLYDENLKVALWVAYPLHDCYLGSSGRSEAWQFDPVIPQSYQMNMARSGFIDQTGYSTYDRGHQLPSADRTVDNATNAATFYYTNMTPQQSSFNRGLWGALEDFVRENMPVGDTLYVVTGCAVTTAEQPSLLLASHKSYGDRIAVPRAYFKVLVRSSVDDELPNNSNAECIGFWLPNVSMTGTKLNASFAMSVSEIEALTGFEFFPMLSPQTKRQLDTSDWSW